MADLLNGQWALVGWDGLTLWVPEDWNIGAIGGDRQQGYLRVDSPDMPRVEIKWAKPGSGHVDISALVDKYLRDMSKGKKNQTEVTRDVQLTSRRKARHKSGVECFAWKSDSQGFGAAWYCPDCEKTIILQVMGTLEEPVGRLADRIIAEMEDHPKDDFVIWSTYGFTCQTPARFKLTGQKLMAGLIELSLEHENEHLHLARWGMANVALKGKTLQEWGTRELGKRVKKFTTEVSEEEYRGHECVTITGRTYLPQEKLMSFVQHCLGKPYADRVKAYLWHCADENKILYVEGVLDRDSLIMLDEVRDRTPCHGASLPVAPPVRD